MRDYFADIVSEGVTGVTGVTQSQNVRKTAEQSNAANVTPQYEQGCNRCNSSAVALHPVTPKSKQGVTLESRVSAALHPLHLVTPDFDEWRYMFEERAAIREYDGLLPREQAEREAFIEVYCEYLEHYPPVLPDQFRQMINGKVWRH